ncbi:MAG TPA: glycosyltransferase [Flavilitoribacter sp.]|nr:glycosyltransferase [Flavilitoribacter sp.]
MITIAFLLSSTALLLAAGYAALLRQAIRAWRRIPETAIDDDWRPQTRISVLIPARNESENIGACLESVLKQAYPTELTEVIVIDDHSEDKTAAIVRAVRDPRLKLLQLADFPEYLLPEVALKKQAVTLGVHRAGGELIVCTDADCIVPADWLRYHAWCYERENCVFTGGPVNFFRESSLLERFQSLDYLGMMLLTGMGIFTGHFHLSNGANLSYSRKAFLDAGGYEDNRHLGSGDDWLLSIKMAKRFPGRIQFLKNAASAVRTRAMPTLKTFIRQRKRWASKSGAYHQWRLVCIQGLVFLLCWSLLLGLIALPWAGSLALSLLLVAWTVKGLADYFFLREGAVFFDRRDLLQSYIQAQFLHVLYFAGIGLVGLFFRQYQWKGRVSR